MKSGRGWAASLVAVAALVFLNSVPIRAVAKDGKEAKAAQPESLPWPFGAAGIDGEKLDLYNLGVLGVKAADADVPLPQKAAAGKRSFEARKDDAAESGPARLRVEILFEGGPAAKAGLVRGDVIVGVAGKPFDPAAGSLVALADAILAAEAGTAKTVDLSVIRMADKPPVTLKLTVPVTGKDDADPLSPKRRRAAVEAAAAWLAQRQTGQGGFPQTLAAETGSCVQASLAGLAWIAAGSDYAKGAYSKNIKKAFAYLQSSVGVDSFGSASIAREATGANWNQTNWAYLHAILFTSELQRKSPSDVIEKQLRVWADELARRQEASGGWAHGPGGKNALGYLELNIVGSMSVLALGMAKQAGWTPPRETMEKAAKYMEDSAGDDGGVGYSTEPGQRGEGNIGRTAATWLGYELLGFGDRPACAKMKQYVTDHAGDVFGGHASLMQHFMLGGVAAQSLGGAPETAYWKASRVSYVLARAPDGSFQPRPWKESLGMNSNTDVSTGDAWTTASWAIVAGCRPVSGATPVLPLLCAQPPAAPVKKK